MKMLTIVIALMFTPFVAHAEWNNHFKHRDHERRQNHSPFWRDVEQRQNRQASRIERGIDKGQLTRREVRKLRREQKHVAKQLRYLRRHNYLSRRDKRDVMEHLDYVSNKIRSMKHNERYAQRGKYNKHNRHVHVDNNRHDRYLSWANNASSAGIYFRF